MIFSLICPHSTISYTKLIHARKAVYGTHQALGNIGINANFSMETLEFLLEFIFIIF